MPETTQFDQVMNECPPSRTIYQRFVKRALDLLGGVVILVVISPLMLAVYVLLRLTIGAPVIFRQTRPGFRGRPFIIYKFRTMTDQRDLAGGLLPDERRSTRVGQMVRSCSLDELPEIFNVLRGEMSFVGPRPLLMQYLGRYTREQARRHEVMPGITGWAQVNGRNALTWDMRFTLDVWYVDHQAFGLDLRILGLTLWKVITREGISREGFFSAPEFMGSDAGNAAGPHSRQ